MLLHAALIATIATLTTAYDLQVVHWNDVRGRSTPAYGGSRELCLDGPYADDSCYGGYARIATLCKEAKAKDARTLCLDAGGDLSGSAWDGVFQGAQTADVLPLIPADATVLSERDFSFGIPALAAYVSALTPRVPVLGACNADVSREPALAAAGIRRWAVVDAAGAKVAILGYTAAARADAASAVKFADPASAMIECLADFHASPDAEGVEVVAFLSSAGMDTDARVAAAVAGVDFIVAGGALSEMFPGGKGACLALAADGSCAQRDTSTLQYPASAAGVPILQQGPSGKYVGVARITLGGDGGVAASSVPLGVHFVDGERVAVAPDDAVATALEGRFAEVVAYERAVVGNLPAPLPAAGARSAETALGNFVCDAALDSMVRAGYEESAMTPLVCLLPAAALRTGLPTGAITNAAIGAAVATGEVTEVVEVTGRTLKAALRHGLAVAGAAFPSVGGGLSAVYSAQDGGALVLAEIDCEEIDEIMTFHVVTTRAAAAGGAGYTMLARAPRVVARGPTLDDAVAGFFGQFMSADLKVPDALVRTEGRVHEVASNAAPLCSTVHDRAAAIEARLLSDAPMGTAGRGGEFGAYGPAPM